MNAAEPAWAAIKRFSESLPGRPPLFMAIGTFDGVHLGHQTLLATLSKDAQRAGAAACAMTFEPRPLTVLRPERALPPLVTLPERVELMRQAGIEHVLVVPFTVEFARTEAEVFVRDVLVATLGVRRIYVGFSFTFGKGGRGTPALLRQLGAGCGLEVREFRPVTAGGGVVSSTAIRTALQTGDVAAAFRALGRPHRVRGVVQPGRQLGRQLSFPTANLLEDGTVLWPADGVYLVQVAINGQRFGGVASVGRRPTVEHDGRRILEVNLLDFDGDLYGREIEVAFIKRLRSIERFPSVDLLRAQIAEDVQMARQMLADENWLCYDSTRFNAGAG